MSDEGWVRAEPAGRGEKARVGVAVVAVLLVVALVVAAFWARQRFDENPSWSADVDGVLAVADSDQQRILFQTETGFTVLSRSDGRAVVDHDFSGLNDQELQTHGDSALALVDDGVLVSASFSAGYSMTGVVRLDGEWRWRQELDRPRRVLGLDPDGGIVVVHEPRTGQVVVDEPRSARLVGLDSRTGEEVWSRQAEHADRAAEVFRNTPVEESRAVVVGAFDSDDRTLVSTSDGSVMGSAGEPGSVAIGRRAVVQRRADCDLAVLTGRGRSSVDWGGVDEPATCQVMPPAGDFAYVAADLPATLMDPLLLSGARIIALDLRSGNVQEMPVSVPESSSLYFPLRDAHRWLATGTADGLVVHDAASGARVWEHTWTSPAGTSRRGGILDAGANGILTQDAPDPWQRWAGGADRAVVTLWRPDGTAMASVYPQGDALIRAARVLDDAEAVVAVDEGRVLMLR